MADLSAEKGAFKIEQSLLARAKDDDTDAIQTMFRQFVSEDEQIISADYMGVQGMWWVGRHSFVCLTNRRIASIMVGAWGEVLYQDGLLEHNNSSIVHQPGLLGLYLTCFIFIVLALIFTWGIGLLLLPYVVQYYYRVHKCGLVWVIREGVSVYLFTNRKRLVKANRLLRRSWQERETRIASIPVSAR